LAVPAFDRDELIVGVPIMREQYAPRVSGFISALRSVRYDVEFDARTVADYGSAAETDDALARQAILLLAIASSYGRRRGLRSPVP
jgi:hypothetical protein